MASYASMKYLLLIALLLIPATSHAVWFDSSWTYRVPVEIVPSKVGTSSAITSFPVYVSLNDMPAGFWSNVKSDGGDVRVVESDETTETAFELVTINTASSTGELHFLADSLSTTSTSTFYVYYGNAGASGYASSSTYGSQNVWNSNYKAVYHLKDGTTLSATDSTSNTKDGTNNGSVGATVGQLDGAGSFNAAGGRYISAASLQSSALTNYTVSAWVKPNGNQATAAAVATDQFGGAVNYALHFTDGASDRTIYGGSYVAGWKRTPGITLADNTWAHVVHTYDGTTMRLYSNYATKASTATTFTPASNNSGFRIGRRWDSANYVTGTIDEVRVMSVAASDAWVYTEYNNQSTTTDFYYVGAPETDGGGGGGASTTPQSVLWFD